MATPAKLEKKFYMPTQRILVRRSSDLMPLQGIVVETRSSKDNLWTVEGPALGGRIRVPGSELAPDIRRDEEIIYEKRDGTDVVAICTMIDTSIWPPSYAIREKDAFSGEVWDTNPGRIWPAKVRAALKADSAMEELLEEEEEGEKKKASKKGGKKK